MVPPPPSPDAADPVSAPAFVAALVPVLDEAAYVVPCLESLLAGADPARLEVLVLDGGSTDGTRALVEAFAARHPPGLVRLVPNPARLQGAACNLGARVADPRADVLVRADAHALYPPGFVGTVAAALRAHAATSVVVPMRTRAEPGGGGMQRAIAAAQGSRLGNGGSAHRVGARSGPVEHGHHAAFDRAFFLALGGYDEAFTHNEDAELDHRALAAGGLVWMCAEAPVTYFPRRTLRGLARQYRRHGAGRARTLLTHRLRPKPRQLAPVAILAGCAGGLLLAPLAPVLLAAPLGYAAACLGWGALAAARARDPWLLAVGPAAMTMHLSWAVGFLRRLARGA